MASSGRTTTTATNKTLRTTKTSTTTTTTRRTKTKTRTRTRQPRRTNIKKNKKQEMITNVLPSSYVSKKSSKDSSREEKMEISEVIDVSNSNNSPCSTPKGQKFRIPEISTCPPAPKKQRVVSNCSLRRSPLSFFVPPDLDHFFLVTTLPDVSV